MKSIATILLVCSALCLGTGCGVRDPIRPYPGEPTPPFIPSVDNYPEWSHDGEWIAYQRRFPSSDGPAGLYLIRPAGGTPRFVALGNFWDPTYIRFSPDDRYLSCVRDFQLLLVDLRTGSVLQPLYTQNGVSEPDWSPDGRMIVYSRYFSFYDTPIDSLGFHVFDITTGGDRTLYYENTVQGGITPVWSNDGKEIIYSEMLEGGYRFRISSLSVDGSKRRSLVESPPNSALSNIRRYARSARGLDGLAFSGNPGTGYGSYFMNWDGSGILKLPRTYSYGDSYSPDGSMAVGARFSPEDSLVVLFVFSADDITTATYRQLTRYRPPSPKAAANSSRSRGRVLLRRN